MTNAQRHVVVFDVNVYLEAAELVGPPFDWARMDTISAQSSKHPVPSATNPAIDSLRVINACSSGKFAGTDPIEVWSCAHIDRLVENKAQHPVTPAAGTDHRGLGWSALDASALVTDLVLEIGTRSNGGTLGHFIGAENSPPLDHEDGTVYGACRYLAGEDPLARIYCVTRDGGFLKAHRDGKLDPHTRVLQPSTMLKLIHAARFHMSVRAMVPANPEEG